MTEVADIDSHRNGLPRRLDEAKLREMVEELLSQGGRLVYALHMLERMEERDITTAQVIQVLRRGQLLEGPTWSSDHESWKFKMQADTAGETVTVVASLCVKPLDGQVVFVITAFV